MSKIGHNNPPKDRKVDWKTISLNKWIYKDLQKVQEHYRQLLNVFRMVDGNPPEKNPTMPWVLEMLIQEKLHCIWKIETQDNGRNFYEQQEKKLLRKYNSSKFHAISLNSKSYKDLKEIQKLIPVRLSVPQTIEWLIKVGQKQIKSEIKNTNVNEL